MKRWDAKFFESCTNMVKYSILANNAIGFHCEIGRKRDSLCGFAFVPLQLHIEGDTFREFFHSNKFTLRKPCNSSELIMLKKLNLQLYGNFRCYPDWSICLGPIPSSFSRRPTRNCFSCSIKFPYFCSASIGNVLKRGQGNGWLC